MHVKTLNSNYSLENRGILFNLTTCASYAVGPSCYVTRAGVNTSRTSKHAMLARRAASMPSSASS